MDSTDDILEFHAKSETHIGLRNKTKKGLTDKGQE